MYEITMARRNSLIFLIVFTMNVYSFTADASIDVSEWELITGVQDFSGLSTIVDFDRMVTVDNPFHVISTAAVGANTSEVVYDFSWMLDSGTFDVAFDHHVETLEVVATSLGHLLLTPSADSRLNISAVLDYAHAPGDDVLVRLQMFVRDETTGDMLFNEFQLGGGLILEPPVGTLAFGGDIVLSAGTPYRIDYLTRIDTISVPNPQGPADSTGLIHFDLQAVPEPSTLSLLATGLLLTRRPRRKRITSR